MAVSHIILVCLHFLF